MVNLPEISLKESPTSYFSKPEDTLDPHLFSGGKMLPGVRSDLSKLLMDHLGTYGSPRSWAHAWVAGSGASYQWSAAREPADLDVLVGVDYPKFREWNSSYAGLSDEEISKHLTQGFKERLTPRTARWSPDNKAHYEATWYVNPHSTDIRKIRPYAAYDILGDKWDVHPDMPEVPDSPSLSAMAGYDRDLAKEILDQYQWSRNRVIGSRNDGERRTAEAYLRDSLLRGSALFHKIHDGRRSAFTYMGKGYSDDANYRWQQGKATGVVQAMAQLDGLRSDLEGVSSAELYHGAIAGSQDALMTALLYEQDL